MSRETEVQWGTTKAGTLTEREVISYMLLPARRRDPYPIYEHLRRGGPVQNTPLGVTTVCSMDAALDILRDPTMSCDPFKASFGYRAGRRGAGILREAPGRFVLRRMSRPDGSHRPFAELQRHLLTRMDAPRHTCVRNAASAAFTPRLVWRATPEVERIAHRLIDGFEASGEAELVSAYAHKLPMVVLCHILGIPDEDLDSFRTWADNLLAAFDPRGANSERLLRRADLAAVAMTAYLSALAAQRRVDPRDDVISVLARHEEDGRHLTADQLAATITIILSAGHETTANLIGNAVWMLHKNLAQRQRFVDEPDLGRSAVEEFLRYESPIQLVQRIATVDREHHGVVIPAGRQVFVLLGAANRDPAHFRDAHRLDIARNGSHPIAFGYGAHHCIGASLASMEAITGLRVLYQRLPAIRPAVNKAHWHSSLVFRGLQRLPVTW
jgi:cytochrome P450